MSKLMVVDDSPIDLNLLTDMLVRAGHIVVKCTSGREAVERSLTERPELIFMDVVMDRMDGFRATREILERPATATVPVVMVTSKNQKADKVWARLQGAKGYLVKPVTEAEVFGVLQELLGA